MATSMSSMSKRKLYALFALAGAVLAVCVIIYNSGKATISQRWQADSPYPVATEYLSTKLFGRLSDGFSPDGVLGTIFGTFQDIAINSALKKIPEHDGERVIWEIWKDRRTTFDMHHAKNIKKIMPIILSRLDKLATLHMASRWASHSEKYIIMIWYGNFFLDYFQDTEMSNSAVEIAQRKTANQFYNLKLSMDPSDFTGITDWYQRSIPFRINLLLYAATTHALFDEESQSIACSDSFIEIMSAAKKDILAELDGQSMLHNTSKEQELKKYGVKLLNAQASFEKQIIKQCKYGE